DELARALGNRLEALRQVVRQLLERWKTLEEKQARGPLEDALRQLDHKREELERRYPEAKARSEPYADIDHGPPLDTCLETLSRNLGRWLRASRAADLPTLAQQLDRVIPDDLQRLADIAKKHIGDIRRAAREIDTLEREID